MFVGTVLRPSSATGTVMRVIAVEGDSVTYAPLNLPSLRRTATRAQIKAAANAGRLTLEHPDHTEIVGQSYLTDCQETIIVTALSGDEHYTYDTYHGAELVAQGSRSLVKWLRYYLALGEWVRPVTSPTASPLAAG